MKLSNAVLWSATREDMENYLAFFWKYVVMFNSVN